MSELGKKGVAAVKWGAISSAGRFVLQLGAQVVLARLLGPDTYGVFGMGLLVFTLSNFLAEFGFGWGLVQKVDLHPDDVRFAFTWQIVTGGVAAGALLLLAPWLGEFFHDARVVPVIQWMALACVLNAASAPAMNLLRRDLNFRAIGLIQIGSYFVGYVLVGMTLAWLGYGVTTLVAAWLTQSAVTLIAAYVKRPHALKPLFHYAGASSMFNMGATVFFTNLVNWFISNLDRVMVGRLLNAHAVGLYTTGSNLSNMPAQLLLGSMQPAFLAAGARMQDDLPKLRSAYLQILATIWALIAPAMTVAALLAPDLVHLVYGAAWTGAGHVLAILFLAVPLQLTWCMTTPVLWNTGRKHHEVLAQLPVLLATLGLFLAFGASGVEAAALVGAGATALRAAVIFAVTLPGTQIGWGAVLARLGRGLALCTVAGAATWLGLRLAAPLHHPLASLMIGGGVAAAVCGGLVLWRPGLLGEEAARMILRFAPRLAGLLRARPPAPSGT